GLAAASACRSADVVRFVRQQLERATESEAAVAGRLGRPCDQVEDEVANSAEARSLRAGMVEDLLRQGRHIFRFDTFGDEAFWGDTLQLHRAIIGAKNGGVGPGVSPKTALAAGLKVDVDALPNSLRSPLARGDANHEDPATTVALLKLNAVIGVKAFTNADGSVRSMGI